MVTHMVPFMHIGHDLWVYAVQMDPKGLGRKLLLTVGTMEAPHHAYTRGREGSKVGARKTSE